jgi:hypothetical protein
MDQERRHLLDMGKSLRRSDLVPQLGKRPLLVNNSIHLLWVEIGTPIQPA